MSSLYVISVLGLPYIIQQAYSVRYTCAGEEDEEDMRR